MQSLLGRDFWRTKHSSLIRFLKRRRHQFIKFYRFTPKDRKKDAPPESSQTSCFRFNSNFFLSPIWWIYVQMCELRSIKYFQIISNMKKLPSRLLLCEVGYQAGQHELLSESLGKLQNNKLKEMCSFYEMLKKSKKCVVFTRW